MVKRVKKQAIILNGVPYNTSAARGIYVAHRCGYNPIAVISTFDQFDYVAGAAEFRDDGLTSSVNHDVLQKLRATTTVHRVDSGHHLLSMLEKQPGSGENQLFVYVSMCGDTSGEYLRFNKDNSHSLENIPAREFEQAMKKIAYGQRFVLGSMCSGGKFLELTVAQYPATTAVASLGNGEALAGSRFNYYFLVKCLEGSTIRDAFESAKLYVNGNNEAMDGRKRTPYFNASEGAKPNLKL
ncbi:MAG: hypothetical protein EPN86_03745 [Nanoarchaeota archaeon]|nr:MAG: hypothetical protein EPN86_03745 [Nanoarchaeota archaeon]